MSGCWLISRDEIHQHDLALSQPGGTGTDGTTVFPSDPDGNYSPSTAVKFDGELPIGETTTLGSEVLGTPGDSDFFSFDAAAGDVYFFRTVSDLPADPVLRVWDGEASLVEADEIVFRADPGDAALYWTAPASGQFFVQVLDWTASDPVAPDAGDPSWSYDLLGGRAPMSEAEPGNDARSVALSDQQGGLLGVDVVEAVGTATTGNTDFFELTFDPRGSWRVALEAAGPPTSVSIVDSFGETLATAAPDQAVYQPPDHTWAYPTIDAALLWQNSSGTAASTLYLQVDGGTDEPYVVAALAGRDEFAPETQISPLGECYTVNADTISFGPQGDTPEQLTYAGHVTQDDSDVIKIPGGENLGGFLSIWAQSASVGYSGIALTLSQGQVVGCAEAAVADNDALGLGPDPSILDVPVAGWSDAWLRVDVAAGRSDAYYFLTIEQANHPRFPAGP